MGTRIAIVRWFDAFFKQGEVTVEDMNQHSLEIISVGHLIEYGEESIKIAADHCPEYSENGYRELQVIPIEYVKSAILMELDSISKPPRKKRRKKELKPRG